MMTLGNVLRIARLAAGLAALVACAPAVPNPTVAPVRPAASPAEKAPPPAAAASPAAAPKAPATPDWEKDWNALVEAARKEGRVVFSGSPVTELRTELPAKFKARYGVEMEYLGVRTVDLVARLRSERAAGQYSVDVVIGGIRTLATEFYENKIIDPLRPVLIHPEVTNGSSWKTGKLWFFDPEDQYIWRLMNATSPLMAVNTAKVDPDELKAIQGLLNPKFKGLIAADDPTVAGGGSTAAAYLSTRLGEPFVRNLYVGQEVRLTRDRRELGDWLARGTYPIVLGAVSSIQPEQLIKEGFPIKVFAGFSDAPGYVSAGTGLMVLMNRAPNRNAAKLLANWLGSREGVDIYSRGEGTVSLRTDVDESWIPEWHVPKPGVEYFDTTTPEFVEQGQAIAARLRAMLGQ